MRVYRIEREKYLSRTLSGIGAAMNEGFRWNSLHTYLAYTSGSRALALLEVSVHLDLSEDLPADRFVVEIEIPSDIQILQLPDDSLPDNWDARPPGRATQLIGDGFVVQRQGAVLRVPSVIVSQEYNYLINPDHPDARKIRVISTAPLVFDGRLSGRQL